MVALPPTYMKVILLGTGTSTGIPEVGCGCPVCHSSDARDRRLRTSALIITEGGKRILIDCGPDFHYQATRLGIDRIDAILLTHEHYDLPDGQVKVPAGWLIDRCGLKGYRLGHAAVYERQALVLVNADGEATGQDIARLAEYVQEQVAERFGLQITPEVRYIS